MKFRFPTLRQVNFRWNRPMKVSLFVGLVAFSLIAPITWQLSTDSDRLLFERQARALINDIRIDLSRLQSAASTLQTAYHANYDIDSDTFGILSQNLIVQMPSIKKISFYPKVLPEDQADFIARQREEGVPGYDIFHFNDGHTARETNIGEISSFPLLYEEPFTPDTASNLGLDLASDNRYATYIDLSIIQDSTFGIDQKDDAASFFVIAPIFEGRKSPSPGDRSLKNTFGFIVIDFDLSKLISDSAGATGLQLVLSTVDSSTSESKILIQPDFPYKNRILSYSYQMNERFYFMNQDFNVFLYEENDFYDHGPLTIGVASIISLFIFVSLYIILYEQVRIREQLHYIEAIEGEKIASMGRLVAGVAHEINTPLGVSVTTVSFLDKIQKELIQNLSDGKLSKTALLAYMDESSESISMLNYNLNRAATLVKNFKLMSSHQSMHEISHFNIRDCVDELLVSLKHAYKNKPIKLFNDCSSSATLESYQGILVQILTNLIMNSIIHGFKNDRVGSIHISSNIENKIVTLIYMDDGQGILPEHQPQMYEPFFTTDRLSGNSGLGLSIVYNCVTQDLKGTIEFEANMPSGVKFTLKLPSSLH